MKILTLNTWRESGPWKERWELILNGLVEYKSDVVAFQELFNVPWGEEVSKKSFYPFLASPKASSSGLVALSRFPIQKSEVYTMKCKSPFEDYLRYCLWAEVSLGGRMIHFFNTHLSWALEDQATRRAQVQEAYEWITSKVGGGDLVLMGDMNATPESDEIKWLVKELELVDAFGYLHPDKPGFSWDNENQFAGSHKPPLPNRRIDFIFVRGKELVENLKGCCLVYTEPDRRGFYASDHFGVLVEIAESPSYK